MILYDEHLNRKEELPVGARLGAKRYTEITLTREDVQRLILRTDYLESMLVGFRPEVRNDPPR